MEGNRPDDELRWKRSGCKILAGSSPVPSATGAVAHLGERLSGRQEVEGSNPSGSTNCPDCDLPLEGTEPPCCECFRYEY